VYRIVVACDLSADGLALLESAPDTHIIAGDAVCDNLPNCLAEADALIVRSEVTVGAVLINAAPKLTVIGRAGTGIDNVDLEAATARGIMVMNTPQAGSIATAEQTFALLLALVRHLPAAASALRGGEWDRAPYVGVQLQGKTLGVIGFGRIGQSVAARATAFGMEVLAYDPYIDDEAARQTGATVTTFDHLIEQADVITLHTGLTPETHHLLGADEFSLMKDGVRIVNAARGALIDESALIAALESGKVAGAALDVFEQEPLPADHPLLALPNVIAVPHLGDATVEARHDVATQIAGQVLDALRGVDFRNVLNLPFVAGPEYNRARPYLELAEKVGALLGQLADGPVQSVEVEVKGDGMADLVKPITVALLKGLLAHVQDEPVNYINAPLVAAGRGIQVSQTRGLEVGDYANLLSCRMSWEGGQHTAAGVLFGGQLGRIVQIDSFRMDVLPEGVVLVARSRDVPGVIGRVGTILAEHGVNIAEWRLGRDEPGGQAMSFVNLDSSVPDACLAELRALPQVANVRVLTF